MLQTSMHEALVEPSAIRERAAALHADGWRLGTVVASPVDGTLVLRYCFYATSKPQWSILRVNATRGREVPSLTPTVIAADFFEREIEDVFQVRFLQHPRPGNLVFHDDRRPPQRVLNEEGAFVMPVGPIFSAEAESALFLLETVGEDVVRSVPRLFYKYRAIEKLAEGKTFDDALLLVERCNGTAAIGNAWSYAQAIENACGVTVPARANALRAYFAELERVRHHVTAIREICASTALVVATSQLLSIEEELLRISGDLAGHRYLFGVLSPGGVARDFDGVVLQTMAAQVADACEHLWAIQRALAETSSFLDRLERVGIIDNAKAQTFELVGPLARASGVSADMRKIQPYGPYASQQFDVPLETEGDGYARLRVLFAEIGQSVRLLAKLAENIPSGAIRAPLVPLDGAAIGWTEAPRGASIVWTEPRQDGTLARLRLTPPSFRNWHGFHIATEEFAFQDFPIILATLDLSVAENDR